MGPRLRCSGGHRHQTATSDERQTNHHTTSTTGTTPQSCTLHSSTRRWVDTSGRRKAAAFHSVSSGRGTIVDPPDDLMGGLEPIPILATVLCEVKFAESLDAEIRWCGKRWGPDAPPCPLSPSTPLSPSPQTITHSGRGPNGREAKWSGLKSRPVGGRTCCIVNSAIETRTRAVSILPQPCPLFPPRFNPTAREALVLQLATVPLLPFMSHSSPFPPTD